MTLPEVTAARVLLAYAPTPREVDIDPLLRERIAAGTRLLLPWVDGEGLHLGTVGDLDADLSPGWRGVREPRVDARFAVAPEQVEAALVPGVGFDRSGHRLGYGSGHFDRLLARLRRATPLIGVAYACQLVEEVPAEGHDVAVGVIVTEAGLVRVHGT
jgi:5-formyltetrahydrofolate cyclo-ligase